MSEVMVALLVVSVLIVAGMASGVAWWRATRMGRERRRIDAETRLAEWQLQSMARHAMLQMLASARQHAGKGQ